jgi:ankyrin repeat protein
LQQAEKDAIEKWYPITVLKAAEKLKIVQLIRKAGVSVEGFQPRHENEKVRVQTRDRDEDADEGPNVTSGNNSRRNSLDRSAGRSRSNSIEDLAERGRRASLEEDRLHSHQGIVHSIDDVGHWTDPRGRTSLDDQRGNYTFQTFERTEKQATSTSTPPTNRARSGSKASERTSLSGQRTSLTGRRPSVSGPQAMTAKPSTGAPKNMIGDIQVKFKIEHEKKPEKKGPSLFELLNVDDQPSGKEGEEVKKKTNNTNTVNPAPESKDATKKEGHHHHHKHGHEDKHGKDKKSKAGSKTAEVPLGGGDLPRGAISLHLIAQKGLKEDVKRALKESNVEIKLNAKTEDGWTPLHIASKNGHSDVVKLLLKSPCDVLAETTTGETPLFLAAENGHHKVVKLILKHEANADYLDMSEPVHIACANGHAKVITEFFKASHKTCHYYPRLDGTSGIHIAAYHGHVQVIRELLKAKRFNLTITRADEKGQTALHMAVLNDHVDVAAYLLSQDYQTSLIREATKEGKTPLHIAAEQGHKNSMRFLLSRNADPTRTDINGRYPLHLSAGAGWHSIVKKLALLPQFQGKFGMLDKPDKFGWTPISLAAQNGQTRVISVLITAGADPNIGEPNEGRTPLHFAAELGHLEVVKVLLTASPKVDVPYKGTPTLPIEDTVHWIPDFPKQWTPLSLAALRGHHEIVKLLIDSGAKPDRMTLWWACRTGQTQVVLVLIQSKKVNVKWCDERGLTCLHSASLSGHVEIVEALIAAGADPTARTYDEGLRPIDLTHEKAMIDVLNEAMTKKTNA